eukprot:Clim_evm9s13 gene=Clim_evmTU9s13
MRYLAKPMNAILSTWQVFKPADRLLWAYLICTIPHQFIGVSSASDVIWMGVFIRVVLFPLVVYGRHYFAGSALPAKVTIRKYYVAGEPVVLNSNIFGYMLDMYPVLVCAYLYAEEGAIIRHMYTNDQVVYNDWQVKFADARLLGIDAYDGLGPVLRDYIPSKIFGEYMYFCYFMFYFIIGGTWLIIYFTRPREMFDNTATSLVLVYLLCYVTYLIYPVKGPFWEYQPPNPDDVGYFFARLVNTIVSGESSQGTATPSSHCAVSMALWLCAILYHRPLAILYIFMVPGLVFATMWGGFHYAWDSIAGVALGCVVVPMAIAFSNRYPYKKPAFDRPAYSADAVADYVRVNGEDYELSRKLMSAA